MNKVYLSVIFISCFGLLSCKKKTPPVNPEIPVNLYTVKAKRVLYYDNYPATTVALSQVSLLSQVQGYLTGIFFTEGGHVTKGQKLYEIDRRTFQAAYDSAVANEQVADGNLKQAQQDADRYDYLNKYNAVAKQLYDHAIITLENAKNQKKAAEEAVKSAKTNLSFAVIYAPFSGTIGFSQVKLGNVVGGATVLNTISTDDPMAVDFQINEKQLSRFEKLQQNKQTGTDSTFTILLPDNSLYPFSGKISVIDRAVDPQAGTIRIRLVYDNPKNNLRAGMSCVLRVHNQDREPQLVLPSKAVVEQMGEYFVFVAKDTTIVANAATAGKDGGAANGGDANAKTDTAGKAGKPKHQLVAIQKKVSVGQTVGPNVVIKSGISEGDKIVVDGVQSLQDGSPITTANKVGPSAGGKGGKG